VNQVKGSKSSTVRLKDPQRMSSVRGSSGLAWAYRFTKKCITHFRTLDARKVTCSNFQTEEPQALSETVQNVVPEQDGDLDKANNSLLPQYIPWYSQHVEVFSEHLSFISIPA